MTKNTNKTACMTHTLIDVQIYFIFCPRILCSLLSKLTWQMKMKRVLA